MHGPLLQHTLRSLCDAHGCANAARAATAMDGGRQGNAGAVAEMRKSGLCASALDVRDL